jgi:tRNA-splicing ligase RtcB (3'-phosphate/5'-hydroxy nucleic acid ligase)
MRDGSIIATGKGNVDWNQSAPHGAGRLMSRAQARRTLSMAEFIKSMDGIFTTSLSVDTLDEAPSAYKPMEEIIANIGDTVEIDKIIRPVYNFKASDD